MSFAFRLLQATALCSGALSTTADTITRCGQSVVSAANWQNTAGALGCPQNPDSDCNQSGGPYAFHTLPGHEDYIMVEVDDFDLPPCAIITRVVLEPQLRYDNDCDGQNRRVRERIALPDFGFSQSRETAQFDQASGDGDCHFRDVLNWDITSLQPWDIARLNDLRVGVSRMLRTGEPCGGTTSNLRVNALRVRVEYAITQPSITDQPDCQFVLAGQAATFHVEAQGTPPFTYQWLKDGLALVPPNTTTTLSIPTASAGDVAAYSCIVRDICSSVSSHSASLQVLDGPQDSSICAEDALALQVSALGPGPFQYQWYHNGAPVGTNSPTILIASATESEAGTWYCDVSGTCGVKRSRLANVTVSNADCSGDFDGNRRIDLSDLAVLLANFGTASSVGDMDGDHHVDITDLAQILSRFGATCSPCTSVTGACCLPVGCQVMNATDCTAQGGNFQGPASTCNPQSLVFDRANNRAIPDGLVDEDGEAIPLEDSILVSDTRSVESVRVFVNIPDHTNIEDLDIGLWHAETATYGLLFGGDCAGISGFVATFDDAGSLLNCASPVTGLILPLDPLEMFAGESAAGTWTLIVTDYANGDVGTLAAWSLQLEVQTCN